MDPLKDNIGKEVLVTADDWFYAPDGKKYKAVWGTLQGISSTKDTLGIKTNARSTNWYVVVGNMVLAGCQVHYVIETDKVNTGSVFDSCYDAKGCKQFQRPPEIYNANEEY